MAKFSFSFAFVALALVGTTLTEGSSSYGQKNEDTVEEENKKEKGKGPMEDEGDATLLGFLLLKVKEGTVTACLAVLSGVIVMPLHSRGTQWLAQRKEKRREIEQRKKEAASKWARMFMTSDSVSIDLFVARAQTIMELHYLEQDGFEITSLAQKIDKDSDGMVTKDEFVRWFCEMLPSYRPDMPPLCLPLRTVFVGKAGDTKWANLCTTSRDCLCFTGTAGAATGAWYRTSCTTVQTSVGGWFVLKWATTCLDLQELCCLLC